MAVKSGRAAKSEARVRALRRKLFMFEDATWRGEALASRVSVDAHCSTQLAPRASKFTLEERAGWPAAYAVSSRGDSARSFSFTGISIETRGRMSNVSAWRRGRISLTSARNGGPRFVRRRKPVNAAGAETSNGCVQSHAGPRIPVLTSGFDRRDNMHTHGLRSALSRPNATPLTIFFSLAVVFLCG